MGISLCF